MTTATVTPPRVQAADEDWSVEATGVGRTVDMLYRPTGDIMTAGSATLARRMIATGDAVAALRAKANMVLEIADQTGAVALRITPKMTEAQFAAAKEAAFAHRKAQRALAARTLAILDGTLLPSGITPDATCDCGGPVAFVHGRWHHVDGCRECWSAPTGWAAGICADRASHKYCTAAEPQRCDHLRCTATGRVDVPACGADLSACCGCCQDC